MTGTIVPLKELRTGKIVEAQFHSRVDGPVAKRADDSWTTYLAQAKAVAATAGSVFTPTEDDHWRWELKVRLTAKLLSYGCMGVEFQGQVQGLMLFVTDGRFSRLPGKGTLPLIYLEFLATAPWNRAEVVQIPQLAGVGTVLLRAAVEASLDLGFKGRIGLHSLPGAEAWYDRRGLSSLGLDAKKRMKYYEFTESQAAAFIR